MNYNELIEYLKSQLKNNDWEEINTSIGFGIGNSLGCGSFIYTLNNKKTEIVLDSFDVSPILRKIFHKYLKEEKKRDFNQVKIRVTKNDYEIIYERNEEKIIKEKQDSALLFPAFLYERMRTLIYEYEVTNNLRKPIYNEDGEIYDYENSWDEGLFTFVLDVKNKTIQHTIQLSFKGVTRIVPMPLETFFQEAFFYHHEITHNLLKEFWQPWNKVVLTAPKNIIPLNKEQDYIEYSLIDIQKS